MYGEIYAVQHVREGKGEGREGKGWKERVRKAGGVKRGQGRARGRGRGRGERGGRQEWVGRKQGQWMRLCKCLCCR